MPTSSADPKGYYAILGVPSFATSEEIKQAFRKRAMELHPDRNTDPNATEQFQALNAAFAVLGNPAARAKYDTDAIQPEFSKADETSNTAADVEPIICSCCKKVTAQPRYVIFYEVKAFLLVATRTALQGVMCSGCAQKRAIKASAITWLCGWWSLHGFLWSMHAILTNLFGGEQSRIVNARLAAHQAWVFAVNGKTELARAVALDALHLAKGIRPQKLLPKLFVLMGKKIEHEGTRLSAQIEELIKLLGPASGSQVTILNNSWSLLRLPFFIQLALGLSLSTLVYIFVQTTDPAKPRPGPKPYSSSPTRMDIERFNYAIQPAPETTKYQRPLISPSGEPWPTGDGYLTSYRQLNTNGRSIVTVDNSQNSSDVFVKLVSLEGQTAYPVRIFFIRGHHSFTLEGVDRGSYDIRYQDLSSGSLTRTEAFTLEEFPIEDGVRYSKITFSLYKVADGNAHTYPLSADEF